MIFLLGGNGFVGSGFARVLEAKKIPFAIITRENYAAYIGKRCDILINANGNSKKFLAKDDPKTEFSASVTSVRHSLVDFRYSTYVFLSTSDIYPDCTRPALTVEDQNIDPSRQSAYGFHKYLAEQCVRHAAQNWLIIRQGGFVGPGLKKNAVYDILHGEKLWVHPDSRFQFIHTEDSAAAILTLIAQGHAHDVINVTGRGTVSAAEIMAMAGRTLPAPTDVLPVTYEISTEKAAQWLTLPSSHETIERFLR